jgi:spore germination cell wall hydrolase CwlJ-like protein
MTQEIVVKNASFVVAVLNQLVKVLGLVIVLYAVTLVTVTRLDDLVEANARPVASANVDLKMRELECLTKNIYWEAGREPFEGKVAVAQVTLNRVSSGKFANTICGVVHQKNMVFEQVICQFSWYCETNHKFKPINPAMWRESEEVAKKVFLEKFRLPSMNEAMYFHADHVNPRWKLQKIDKIGRHIFYKDRA